MAIPIRFTFDISFDPRCIPIPVDLDYGLKLIWKKDPTVSGPETDSSVWYILNSVGKGKMEGDGGSAILYMDTSKTSGSDTSAKWVYVLEITPDTIPPSTVNTEFYLSYDAASSEKTLTSISPPENDFLVDESGIANFILPVPIMKKTVCIRYVLQAFNDLNFPENTVKFFLTGGKPGAIAPGSVKISWVKKISDGNYVTCFAKDSISTENTPEGALHGDEAEGEISYATAHASGTLTLNYDPGLYDKNTSLRFKMDFKVKKYSYITDTISAPKLDPDGFITIKLTKSDLQENSTISVSIRNILVADMYGVIKDPADKETCLVAGYFSFFGTVGGDFFQNPGQNIKDFDPSSVTVDRENGILKFKFLGLKANAAEVPKTATKTIESVPVIDANGVVSIKNIEKYKYDRVAYVGPYMTLSEKTKITVYYAAQSGYYEYIAADAIGYGVNWISDYIGGSGPTMSFNKAYKEQLVYDDGNGGWERRFADKTKQPVVGTINYETGVCQFDTNVENAFVLPPSSATTALQNGRGRNVPPSVLGSTLYPPLPRVEYLQKTKTSKNFTLRALVVPLPEKSSGSGVTPGSTTIVAGGTVLKDDNGTLKSTDPVTGAQTSVGTVTAKPAPAVTDSGDAVPVTPTATITQWPQIANSTASVSAAAPANKEEEIGASSPRLLFRTASAPLVPGSLSFTVDFAREYKKITPTNITCPKVSINGGTCVIGGYGQSIFSETGTMGPLTVAVEKTTTTITAITTTKILANGQTASIEGRDRVSSLSEIIIPDAEITLLDSNKAYFSTSLPDSNPPPAIGGVPGALPAIGTYWTYNSAKIFNAPVGADEPLSISVTAQSNGQLAGTAVLDPAGYPYNLHVYGSVDYVTGVVDAIFGVWMTREDAAGYAWYSEDMPEDADGKVFYAHPVVMGSVKYNAVAYSDVPIDAAMLGIDAARLPSDGRVPVFYDGQMVLVHHTGTHAETTLSASQAVDMGRTRLYRVAIDDSTGKRLPADFYSVNRATGVVTMASDLSLTGYSGPYTFRHTIADLARVIDADLSGALSLNKPITHDYPADESSVSGAMYAGTLQARVSRVFSQQTWTSVWSDTRIGDAPLAQYNNTQWPISVSNRDAAPDRYLIQFTSSSAFRLIGEQQGIINTGNINEDFSPINTLTGRPIMTIDYRGWGLGWSTGNVLRFNVTGASVPIALTRAVMPSEPTGTDDSVELLLIGNIDA